jgi:hypothetical protein
MKKLFLFIPLYFIISAYDPVEYYDPYSEYLPIIITRETLNNSVRVEEPRELKDPGRIYIKDAYIYIIENYKGIHIINNTNPEDPLNEKFIRIPGCLNMAIKNNTILADNAVDLIAIDISDLSNIQVTSRVMNTFPELETPDKSYFPQEYNKENRPDNTVIIGFEKTND